MSNHYQHDILIIGSGAAGLSLALRLADYYKIALVSKESLAESATLYAQGGVSAVLDDDDSIESHVEDTLIAGAGLCHPDVVRHVVKHGRENIEWLFNQGVQFTRDAASQYHLNREGGHSHRRIIHAADKTGKEIELTLQEKVLGAKNIQIFEQHTAVDLITASKLGKAEERCLGAYVFDKKTRETHVFKATFSILASGGAGRAYLYTSNPDISTGDGIAMAWRAGCRIANMEFIQFHPTCLYHPDAKSFLISEALRGEGARLVLKNGEQFMHKYHEQAELAPRDVVARAIDHEMKTSGSDSVYLDISHKDHEFILDHFPTIYAKCLKFGFDITQTRIPVVPAAHYTCGGVVVDKEGKTDIPNLMAIGEVTCTGLHGANRMASNSLLECVVYARACFDYIRNHFDDGLSTVSIPDWDESQVTDSDEEVVVSHNWEELRRFMWDYVGIVRSDKRLARAQSRVDLLRGEIQEYYGNFKLSNDLIELRNLTQIASLIIESALLRKESRGLHFTINYPEAEADSIAQDTVIQLNR